MGRGLSELQRRILLYVRHGERGCGGGTVWLDANAPADKDKVREPILPGKPGRWTASGSNGVSRALGRLEARGLGVRPRRRSERRTVEVTLTAAGRELVASLEAGRGPIGET